jgi:hypothetical protein
VAIEIPHTAWPLRYVNGHPVVVEQDSPQHMRDRINVTCRTPLGDALHDPTFGIPDQLLRVVEVDLDALAAALNDSEPDIAVAVGRVEDGATGMALAGGTDESIRIDVEAEN